MRVVAALLLWTACLPAATLTPDRMRDSAAKAIGLLQKTQNDWYAKQTCYSCHNQILPAQAFRAAREHGIAVTKRSLTAMQRRASARTRAWIARFSTRTSSTPPWTTAIG